MDTYANRMVFNETMNHIENSAVLKDAVRKSIEQTAIYEQEAICNSEDDVLRWYRTSLGKIEAVYNEKSFSVAQRVAEEGKKVAVLNMANPFNPGGGVVHGAQAQEEDLCRCSTLAPVLFSDWLRKWYYERNVQRYSNKNAALLERYPESVLYSPEIIVFRNDRSYEFLEKPFPVDIITCAAPIDEAFIESHPYGDVNNGRLSDPVVSSFNDNEAFCVSHRNRARTTLRSAFENGVDILVLGAIGCGAFWNSHELVAKAWGDVIKEYGGFFQGIYYAVYDPDGRMGRFVEKISEYM